MLLKFVFERVEMLLKFELKCYCNLCSKVAKICVQKLLNFMF
jgi:hypothetical protein